jgi:hypothetical protein
MSRVSAASEHYLALATDSTREDAYSFATHSVDPWVCNPCIYVLKEESMFSRTPHTAVVRHRQ